MLNWPLSDLPLSKTDDCKSPWWGIGLDLWFKFKLLPMNIFIKWIFTVEETLFGSLFSQFCSVLCFICGHSVGERCPVKATHQKTGEPAGRTFSLFKGATHKSGVEGQELQEAVVWILNICSAWQNQRL